MAMMIVFANLEIITMRNLPAASQDQNFRFAEDV